MFGWKRVPSLEVIVPLSDRTCVVTKSGPDEPPRSSRQLDDTALLKRSSGVGSLA